MNLFRNGTTGLYSICSNRYGLCSVCSACADVASWFSHWFFVSVTLIKQGGVWGFVMPDSVSSWFVVIWLGRATDNGILTPWATLTYKDKKSSCRGEKGIINSVEFIDECLQELLLGVVGLALISLGLVVSSLRWPWQLYSIPSGLDAWDLPQPPEIARLSFFISSIRGWWRGKRFFVKII